MVTNSNGVPTMTLADYPELFWLTATVAITALMWLPYIACFIAETGVRTAIWDPHGAHPLVATWAQRAHRAHQNAVENLVIFAPLVLVVHALGVSNDNTALAATVYFWCRAAHYLIYSVGLPMLRTVVFIIAWACQGVFVWTLLS